MLGDFATGIFPWCMPLPYSSARAATSSRQKSGMSGTTRPQTEWKAGERRRDTSPTIAWAAWKGPKPSGSVGAGMGRQMATGSGVASTAFEWVHARWDNAGGELLRPPRPRRRGDGATGGVASARSVEWRSVTYGRKAGLRPTPLQLEV